MMNDERTKPNILVTGTPGTGKSTLCSQVAEVDSPYTIDVDKRVPVCSENGMAAYRQHDCLILDEDQVVANMLVRSQMRDRACHQVCDALEEIVCHGGCLVDYHSCDFFPERWFDLILVLQTDNTLLYDRLAKRGYSEQKIQENVTCEIMHVLVEEARESYREECVQVLKSDSVEEMDTHVEHLCRWIEQNTHL